jgi:flagellar biosynthesis/type III secretory pathway chaperone
MTGALPRLAELLDMEIETAARLLDALDAEHALLAGADAGALEQAVSAKERRLAEFDACEADRRRALAALGHGPDRAGMADCLRALEEPRYVDGASIVGPVAARWHRLLALVARLRDANERNGTVVSLRSRRVRAALNVLRTGRPDELTYGPARPGAAPRRALGRA